MTAERATQVIQESLIAQLARVDRERTVLIERMLDTSFNAPSQESICNKLDDLHLQTISLLCQLRVADVPVF